MSSTQPVLIAGQDFRIYTVERDQEVIDSLIEIESEFWNRVESMQAPDDASEAAMRKRFPFSTSNTIEATGEDEERLLRYREIEREIEERQAQLSDIRGALMQSIGPDGDALKLGNRIAVRWKTQTSYRLDDAALKQRFPDLAAMLRKPSSSRPFKIDGKVIDKHVEKLQTKAEESASDG